MKISVITAVWNAEKSLARCVESVKGNDVEHLLMDNCSTDRTVAIARELDPAVRVISEPDKGIYDAMNRGAERASGEILAWLNADDYYLPGTLEKVAAIAYRTLMLNPAASMPGYVLEKHYYRKHGKNAYYGQ